MAEPNPEDPLDAEIVIIISFNSTISNYGPQKSAV